MTVEIFWISGSPFAWRVQLALELKRAPYASRLLQASKREHRSPEFLAVNARGKVPALRDGEYVLSESLAILAYLDRKFPKPPLFGRTAEETGRVWKAISEFECYANPAMTRIIVPIFFNETAGKADDIRAAAAEVGKELALLEATLGARDWLAGAAVSAADIVAYPHVESLLRAAGKQTAAAFDLGLLPFERRFPAVAAWRDRVRALPGYDKTYPPHWRPQVGA